MMLSEYNILFCSDYFNNKLPDIDYQDEYDYLKSHGVAPLLFSQSDFFDGGRLILPTASSLKPIIYRGWMMNSQQYQYFYRQLLAKNYQLINDPQQYVACHYLPDWYPLLKNMTPYSICFAANSSDDEILKIISHFPYRQAIVKDYVKSRKHEWFEACFIPDMQDLPQALLVIKNFIQRQGQQLVGEVILRKFETLNITQKHQISAMPLAREVRVFVVDHQPITATAYWQGDAVTIESEMLPLLAHCRKLNSRFYSVDLAQKQNGEWVIIEVGDGQVSGLQDMAPEQFYQALLGQA